MNDINVKEILKKHTSVNSEESWSRNGKFEITNYQAAIKEIVEAVIDKCTKEAKTKDISKYGFGYVDTVVDKESILDSYPLTNIK